MKQEYVPGVCNIGREEIRMRWVTGWVGLTITVAIWVALMVSKSQAQRYVWLFVPAFVSALGILQASMHFCVAFGAKGLFNVKSQLGATETVDQTEFRAKDRAKAIRIMLYAFGIATIVTGIAYFTAGWSN